MKALHVVFMFALLVAAPLRAEPNFIAAGFESPGKAAAQPAAKGEKPVAALQAPALPQEEEYRVGANDLLEITVFQVKELDRMVRVNSRGLITLPLIGIVPAAGLTATELEARIAAKLQESYLQDPQVSVFIKEFTSQRVTVEGQVQKAGIYPITGQTTLLQALALSGGLTRIGDDNVSVFRLAKDGTRQMTAYNLEDIRSGKRVDPALTNNDIVVVGTNEVRSFIETVRGFISFGTLR